MKTIGYVTVTVVAIACTLGGCVETADMIDAALMTPVFKEDFETPAVKDAQTVVAGHALQTQSAVWDVMTGQLELFNAQARPETPAFDGTQAVRLTSSAESALLAVRFPTIPGQQYTLAFHYAHQAVPESRHTRARVEVIGAGGMLLEAEYGPEDPTFRHYRRYSGNFIADHEHTTLRFTAPMGATGLTLDGIAVLAVPPPLPIPPPPQIR